MIRPPLGSVLRASLLAVVPSCGGPLEAPQVVLPAVVDRSGIIGITTDLGYTIELVEARTMVEDLTFATMGEVHTATRWRNGLEMLVPTAHAHPGHPQNGDITGELRGRFELNWLPGGAADLGPATLLAGFYESANFRFTRGREGDGLAVDDPLLGHTALFRGYASHGSGAVEFTAVLSSPDGRELVGALFEFEVEATSTEHLGVRLLTADPLEEDTLFDGIDFAALDPDGDGRVRIEPGAFDAAQSDAYNRLLRSFQTHDHFDVRALGQVALQAEDF